MTAIGGDRADMAATVPRRYGTANARLLPSGDRRWQNRAAVRTGKSEDYVERYLRECPDMLANILFDAPAIVALHLWERLDAVRADARVQGLNRQLRLDVAREDSESDLARYAYEADPSEATRRRLLRELEEDVAVKLTYLRELRAKGE